MPPPEPGGRPIKHLRWPAFCAVLRDLRFNPKLLSSDAEWLNHGGPAFWALFLEGVRVGETNESRVKHLERQRVWNSRARAARIAAGLCPRCGGRRPDEGAMCPDCRRRLRDFQANHRNRLNGGG